MPRIRQVKWTHKTLRDLLTQTTKNSLGAIQTLFSLKQRVADDLQQKAVPIEQIIDLTHPILGAKSNDADENLLESLIEKSDEAIEARIVQLDWEQLQLLVAGILRAMGYRTNVSPRGADRGVDIFASPDGLGLEDPRIFVEVKHRSSTSIGSQSIRSFLGGRSIGDKCLYVSTGGFTKDARYEADRASVPLQLIGLVDLRRLYVSYYDQLDEETKSFVPLKRIHVLAD